MLDVISLGAGVQSTALYLMAARGLIQPMPAAAIFADTQWEPAAVYQHLAYLEALALPIPIIKVSAGNIREDALRRSNTTGGRFAAIPWFTLSKGGKAGMGRRQCTKEYKVRPIQRQIVKMMNGKRHRAGAALWIGISTDEALRQKPSQVRYIVNRFPLIEAGMSRAACRHWIASEGFRQPPKSSCIGCPFHDDAQWRALSPAERADAIEIDRAIRNQPGFGSQQFMHRSRRPLEEIDLSRPEDHGQIDLFNNDCEGMCGV